MTVRVVLSPPVPFILRQTGTFKRNLLNLSPLWDKFKPVMSAIEQERFDTEGHGQWPALADSTIQDRLKHGYSAGPILQRTRDLADSLIDPNRAAQTGPRHMIWGTDVAYAHYHQDGGTVAGRPPRREILDIRVDDRRKLEQAQVQWINEIAARTFGRI